MGGSPFGTNAIDSEEDREKWREAVGEVNLRLVNMEKKYIRRIASLLKPEAAVAFQQKCYEKAYWHILGDSATDGMFDFAKEQMALRGKWRERIAELRVEFGLDEPEGEASED